MPMIPSIVAGLLTVLVMAWFLGRQERKRIGKLNSLSDVEPGKFTAAKPAEGVNLLLRDKDGRLGEATHGAAAMLMSRPNARPKLVWLNFLLTMAVMTLLVIGPLPPSVIFLIGASIALILNFPQAAAQAEQIKTHATSIVGVVGLVFAATVLTGVLSGSGMVDAMAKWLVSVIPESWGPHLAIVAGVISIPMTFFTSNDAFFFGILPILSEAASHYGISPLEMARASIVGQPLHQSSPLVPSFLLLCGLAKVELGEHSRKTIWRAIVVSLVMLVVGGLTGAYPL
ncbi:SLC13 family permease [Roseateles chitinivorans]|uniref:SLC13 family permease n=1 Tax=Roseateles chitinivorans TaxID=2917965 RepID=UPI003D674A4B